MLIVTGLIHSGTSPLARIAHQAGIVMGTEMTMMVGGDLEWEDSLLSLQVVNWGLPQREDDPADRGERCTFFRNYIQSRRGHFNQMQEMFRPEFVQGFGVKCPALAIWWRELAEAAGDVEEPLVWVRTTRDRADVDTSLLNEERRLQGGDAIQMALDLNDHIDHELRGELKTRIARRYGLKSQIQERPEEVGRHLLELMGLDAHAMPDNVGRGIRHAPSEATLREHGHR